MTTPPEQLDLAVPKAEVAEFYEIETRRPDPQRGFPELWWMGKRPFHGVHYYPAQHRESHGDAVDGWRNKIYWGDNLQVMGHLCRSFRGEVKLIYIDPPFDSKADYKRRVKLRGETILNDRTAFEEKQYSDLWTNDEYLQFMYERLFLMRELLASDGSIYVHCDFHRAPHLRLICDEVFGPERFQREIIWRIGWISGYKSAAKNWIRNHETILFYTRSESFTFNKGVHSVSTRLRPPRWCAPDWRGVSHRGYVELLRDRQDGFHPNHELLRRKGRLSDTKE